jgi:hypothetical protein
MRQVEDSINPPYTLNANDFVFHSIVPLTGRSSHDTRGDCQFLRRGHGCSNHPQEVISSGREDSDAPSFLPNYLVTSHTSPPHKTLSLKENFYSLDTTFDTSSFANGTYITKESSRTSFQSTSSSTRSYRYTSTTYIFLWQETIHLPLSGRGMSDKDS